MRVGLSLKYAARHALKRQPAVGRRCAGLLARERDPEAIERRQHVLLARTLRAAARLPAYAQAARRVPPDGLADYLRDAFPVIDKSALLHRRADYYPNRGQPRAWWPVGKTSGTTGTPLDVFRSVDSILWEEAFHLQHWRWTGWRPGERQVVLRGDLVVPATRREPPWWVHDRAGEQLILSTRHLSEATVEAFVQAARDFGARRLRAYPSAAYEWATLIERRGLVLRLDAVVTGSEPLYPFQRERIEAVFGARVHDFYGMAERVAFAIECEHGGLHVHPEYGLLEIVDANGQPTDGAGSIVGTTLHNGLMPLIRYRLNDTARWRRDRCPCGRAYPCIERLTGRTADVLFDLRGLPVNPTVISFAFKGLHHIERAQVAQTARDRWVVRLVAGKDYSRADGDALLGNLGRLVSPDVRASVELVDDIPSLDSGKYKWVSQEWAGQ